MAGPSVQATMSDLYYNLNSTSMELHRYWSELLDPIVPMCKNAEQEQYERQEVKEWLDKVQDALYRTEDVVDEICTDDMNPRLDASHATSQTKKSMVEKLHFWDKLVRSLRLWPKQGRKVEKGIEINGEIIDELYSLGEQGHALGLHWLGFGEAYRSIVNFPSVPKASSFVDDSEVFGRDRDEEAIIELLLSDDASGEGLSVIPIVAEDGMGKTTLAQLVYHNHKVSEHFDIKAWAWAPGEDDVLSVTKSIFESFTSQSCDLKELSLLQDRLRESLQNKKFLIVLDDVSVENYSYWSQLLYPFIAAAAAAAAKGSRIIVTTHHQSFESFMRSYDLNPLCMVPAYNLEPLSDEECWSIFVKFAFGDKDPNSYPELEAIGRQFVQESHGVPLAVRTLGALLQFKLTVEEWQGILDCLKHFRSSSEMSGIRLALRLSYHYLHPRLKQCFAYCSIFPRGYEFEREKLVLLWMAEDLLHKKQNPTMGEGYYRNREVETRTMEEIGDSYFRELLYRSFFQRSGGNESRFVMHSLMNDLAIAVSGEFCFRLEDNPSSQISKRARYLSLSGKYDSSMIFEAIDKAKFLRTFLPLDHESRHLSSNDLQLLVPKLQFLRVLSLSHYNITELPDSIGDLKLLRYIDLYHTAIKRLPESVCALRNLQTLILSNCHSLTELPEHMWKLSNLRHLDISGTDLNEMPKDMSKLKNLQTLSNFVVSKKINSTIKELGGILYLHGKLCISKLQNVVSRKDAAKAGLEKKTQLDELVLEWSDNTVNPKNDGDVLEQLVPCPNLKKLSIKFYGGTSFPNWLSFSNFQNWLGHVSFSNMVFICLSNCNNCLKLPPLGQLPSLEVLIIECMNAMKTVDHEFCGGNKQFQSLKSLTFEGMLEWEKWNPLELQGGEFPRLQELCIRRCPKLMGNLPKQLPSVVKVEISESQNLVTALMKEASLHNWPLHYHDKVLFINDDKVASFSEQMAVFTNEDAAKSPLPMTQGAAESSSAAAECSLPTTQGAAGSSSAAAECSLPMTQSEAESSSPMTINISDEIDVRTTTWSNQDEVQDLSSFESMKVSEISQLLELPNRLHSLKIEGCDALEDIPEEVMESIPFLQHLYIINCCSLKSFAVPTALEILYIQNCKKLKFAPPAKKTYQFAHLEHLCIGSSCDSLRSLTLYLSPKLRCLSIWDCKNLESLSMPEGIQEDLTSLEALEIRDCPNLVSFPNRGLPTPNLTSIWLSNCKNLKGLPHQLHTLNSLRSNFINNCPELVSFPEGGLPSKLSLLCITSCNKLMLGTDWGLHRLEFLSQLEIEGGCENVVSFPEEELLPRNLNSLRISRLLNLEYLDYKGLQHLAALQTLEISCCNKLQSLPEEGLPSSLSVLCIKECSLLKPKLQKQTGKYWPKIAHISFIETDEEVIKDWSKKSSYPLH